MLGRKLLPLLSHMNFLWYQNAQFNSGINHVIRPNSAQINPILIIHQNVPFPTMRQCLFCSRYCRRTGIATGSLPLHRQKKKSDIIYNYKRAPWYGPYIFANVTEDDNFFSSLCTESRYAFMKRKAMLLFHSDQTG